MLLGAFYRSAFRRKLYRSIAELLRDLDAWIAGFNEGTKRALVLQKNRRWRLSLTRCRSRSVTHSPSHKQFHPCRNLTAATTVSTSRVWPQGKSLYYVFAFSDQLDQRSVRT